MPFPRPFLLLVGDEDRDAPLVRSLAMSLLGEDGHAARSVPASEVGSYYRAADVFALASVWEAFGRALVEAMSHGVCCIAHDWPVQRWVLGSHGSSTT